MQTERNSAIRLLQLLMIAALVVPAGLFLYAAYRDYRDVHAIADERIERSLDVLQEQGLTVFETVDRIFPEVGEVVRGMSNDEISAAGATLTSRLQRIVTVMPEVQSIAIIGPDGRPLAASNADVLRSGASFADRDFFKAQTAGDDTTFVGDVHASRFQAPGNRVFDVSRRLASDNGRFRGIIAVAVRPRYFDTFYALLVQSPGNFYALARPDGVLLARYPAGFQPSQRLTPRSRLRTAIDAGATRGLFSATSEVDGHDRRVGFRRLPGYAVYAVAGIDASAIQTAWIERAAAHLVFGLPATLLLFFTLWVALRRTRRLHAEAQRREMAEDALRQAQRLEAIGQLTGGVAHDFNNLLMVVGGTAQRLRRHVTGDEPTRLLDSIAHATARGESLTRQLLAFSRRQMHQPAVIDIAERLPAIKDMLSRSLRGDIDIRLGVPRQRCAVKVDASEFELALLNLAFNARDAMPSGGTLTISAKPLVLRGKESEDGLSGDFVAVRVADTGTGIPPDVLPRVFEPFFTTKEVGKGTGLGLSQVYGFARQSGGSASISTSRRGTAITVLLPRTWETAIQPQHQHAAGGAAPAAGAVLLVEDNAEVADVAKSYFEQLGYRVRHANSAQAGLDLVAGGERIDLVFSDILMPGGMNGLEFVAEVRRQFPDTPVLLTTGYSSSAQDALRSGFEVLQKPFDLGGLQRAVRSACAADDSESAGGPKRAVG